MRLCGNFPIITNRQSPWNYGIVIMTRIDENLAMSWRLEYFFFNDCIAAPRRHLYPAAITSHSSQECPRLRRCRKAPIRSIHLPQPPARANLGHGEPPSRQRNRTAGKGASHARSFRTSRPPKLGTFSMLNSATCTSR